MAGSVSLNQRNMGRLLLLRGIASLLVAVVISCGPSHLSREKAMSLLQNRPEFQTGPTLRLVIGPEVDLIGVEGQSYRAAADAGIIAIQSSSAGADFRVTTALTTKAQDAIRENAWKIEPMGEGKSVLTIPVAIANCQEITGVSESGNEATVQYRWHYQLNTVGEEIKKHTDVAALNFIVNGFDPVENLSGRAFFRRYDNGWRVETVDNVTKSSSGEAP
jgi:hypothetical protein